MHRQGGVHSSYHKAFNITVVLIVAPQHMVLVMHMLWEYVVYSYIRTCLSQILQAKFAEEDLLLKERLDRLNNEINRLNTCTVTRQTHSQTRRVSFDQVNLSSSSWTLPPVFSPTIKSPHPIPVLCVSDSTHSIPVPLEQPTETDIPFNERAVDWTHFEGLDLERDALSQSVHF